MGQPAAEAAPSPSILVVDDIAANRKLMRRVLERSGLRVSEAADGRAALAAIQRDRPDAVVLDLRMPGLSGFEVARAVRADADPAIAGVTLLACSASVQDEVVEEALEAGCDAFEAKPFDVRTFADLLLGLIAQRASR